MNFHFLHIMKSKKKMRVWGNGSVIKVSAQQVQKNVDVVVVGGSVSLE